MNDYRKMIKFIQKNNLIMKVFEALEIIEIGYYYIGAGAIAQTIWNIQTNKDACYGISDVDIVFFNTNNLSKAYEENIKKRLLEILGDFPLWLDVKNQARVHLWYKEKFGYNIQPYTSLESAINSWPTTASSVGVRKQGNKWEVYAPFGIDDLMSMKVIPNNRQITEEIYYKKVEKWLSKWQNLSIYDWNDKLIPLCKEQIVEIKL